MMKRTILFLTILGAVFLCVSSIKAEDTEEGLQKQMSEVKAKMDEANSLAKKAKDEQKALDTKINELKEGGKEAEAKELEKQKKGLGGVAWKKTREARSLKKEFQFLQHRMAPIKRKADIEAAVAKVKAVKPKKERKLLIYTRSTGFRHSSIPFGAAVFKELGEKTGAYTPVVSDEQNIFEGDLDQYDGIMMANGSGEPIAKNYRKKFEEFASKGKGIIGIHAATDSHKWGWDYYPKMIGGIFHGHPWSYKHRVTLYNEEPDHPICKDIPTGFQVRDEIYQFKTDDNYSRDRLRVLLTLDLTGPKMMVPKMKRKDGDYAVAWIHEYKGARVFYSSLGHNNHVFLRRAVLQQYLNGIQWALGDLKADARPSAEVGNGKARPIPAK